MTTSTNFPWWWTQPKQDFYQIPSVNDINIQNELKDLETEFDNTWTINVNHQQLSQLYDRLHDSLNFLSSNNQITQDILENIIQEALREEKIITDDCNFNAAYQQGLITKTQYQAIDAEQQKVDIDAYYQYANHQFYLLDKNHLIDLVSDIIMLLEQAIDDTYTDPNANLN